VEFVENEIWTAVRIAIEYRSILPVTSTARRIAAAQPNKQLSQAEIEDVLVSAAIAARVPMEID
jgi:hypothetical protein